MPNLNESLFENPEITDYFILDSNGEKYGQKDKDYSTYCYNIHRNKRLSKNSIFLYRKPQKLTSDSKFVIYGGGMISSITKPDENGDVTAHIKNGFVLPNPIHQDDITQDDIKKLIKKMKINIIIKIRNRFQKQVLARIGSIFGINMA